MEDKEQNKKDTQHRDWLFTINNPEQTEKEIYDYLTALNHIKYFTFQREKGEQGTEHYQGYLCYSVPKLFSTVKNLFSEPNIRPAAHLEPRKGTKTQAREYCQKTDTRIGDNYEYGEFIESGERADIKQLKQLIEQGADDIELADNVTSAYARHLPFVDRYREKMVYQKFGKIRRLNLEVT